MCNARLRSTQPRVLARDLASTPRRGAQRQAGRIGQPATPISKGRRTCILLLNRRSDAVRRAAAECSRRLRSASQTPMRLRVIVASLCCVGLLGIVLASCRRVPRDSVLSTPSVSATWAQVTPDGVDVIRTHADAMPTVVARVPKGDLNYTPRVIDASNDFLVVRYTNTDPNVVHVLTHDGQLACRPIEGGNAFFVSQSILFVYRQSGRLLYDIRQDRELPIDGLRYASRVESGGTLGAAVAVKGDHLEISSINLDTGELIPVCILADSSPTSKIEIAAFLPSSGRILVCYNEFSGTYDDHRTVLYKKDGSVDKTIPGMAEAVRARDGAVLIARKNSVFEYRVDASGGVELVRERWVSEMPAVASPDFNAWLVWVATYSPAQLWLRDEKWSLRKKFQIPSYFVTFHDEWRPGG